jgi:hypothetical protein
MDVDQRSGRHVSEALPDPLAGFDLKTPNLWRRKFNAVAGWIPKVDRLASTGPGYLPFNLNAAVRQVVAPAWNIARLDGEGHMSWSLGAVRRNLSTPSLCCFGIEEQYHTVPAAEKSVATLGLGKGL